MRRPKANDRDVSSCDKLVGKCSRDSQKLGGFGDGVHESGILTRRQWLLRRHAEAIRCGAMVRMSEPSGSLSGERFVSMSMSNDVCDRLALPSWTM